MAVLISGKKNMFKAKNTKKDQRKVFIIGNRRHNTQNLSDPDSLGSV